MKRLALFIILLFLVPNAMAEETLHSIVWNEVKAAGNLSGGEVILAKDESKGAILKIDNSKQTEKKTSVITIDNPDIKRAVYALIGEVSYKDVNGKGYIEMISHFPGSGSFFTRTLTRSGPLAALKGSSGWRPFMLPFFMKQGDPEFTKQSRGPEKLTISVVLPEGGVVYLSSLRLVQYENNKDPFALFSRQSGHWWSERTAGIAGGICGTIIGCLGGLIGLLAGKGKARSFVTGLMKTLVACGAIGILSGIIALVTSQPYAVYYPLLLGGGITFIVFGALLGTIRKRYERMELRKIQAMDVR